MNISIILHHIDLGLMALPALQRGCIRRHQESQPSPFRTRDQTTILAETADV